MTIESYEGLARDLHTIADSARVLQSTFAREVYHCTMGEIRERFISIEDRTRIQKEYTEWLSKRGDDE